MTRAAAEALRDDDAARGSVSATRRAASAGLRSNRPTRSAALQGCRRGVGRPEGLRYRKPREFETRSNAASALHQPKRVVGPCVLAEPGDAPQLAERLERACGFCRAHVGAVPAQ